jgi:hypothetical protein
VVSSSPFPSRNTNPAKAVVAAKHR